MEQWSLETLAFSSSSITSSLVVILGSYQELRRVVVNTKN